MAKKKPKEVCPVCEWDINRCLGHTPGEALKLMHRQRELLRIERDRYREALKLITIMPNLSGYSEIYRVASDAIENRK